MRKRIFNPLKSGSFFLFGARGTGKSTYLQEQFGENAYYIDLLDEELQQLFSVKPSEFEARILANIKNFDWIIVDEIQKIPALLNYIHRLIQRNKIKFVLTGSSSRQLKKRGTNLLAGRAFVYNMFPLTYQELLPDFKLNDVLRWGSLPGLLNFSAAIEKEEFLKSYTHTYIREEIQMEQLVRDLQPFRSFLPLAAQMSSEIVNYKNIADDLGISSITSKKYFDILVDTHLGIYLEPYGKSVRKRQRVNPKFYFFDCGVTRALQLKFSMLEEGTFEYGKIFEQFIVLEIYRLNNYLRSNYSMYYLRTKDDAEIDLIMEKPGGPNFIIEIKSKANIDERDAKSLNVFIKDFKKTKAIILSNDIQEKKYGHVQALFWQKGIADIFKSL